jgi:phosphohistidine swiveling domain-containing protein
MADPAPSPAALEERIADLTEAVNKLIGVVSRLDDETSDTAAAAFDSDVPRVAGHKATSEELKSLSDTLDAWLKEWDGGNAG